MIYVGGKNRIGASLFQTILAHTDERQRWVEPFLGGGGMLRYVCGFQEHWLSDSHPDLIALWRAALSGKLPPNIPGTLACCTYADVEIRPTDVIYADPPYASTQGFRGCVPFDSAEFWAVAARWRAKGASVFVSEQCAPSGWHAICSRELPMKLRGGTSSPRAEHLWVPEDQYHA